MILLTHADSMFSFRNPDNKIRKNVSIFWRKSDWKLLSWWSELNFGVWAQYPRIHTLRWGGSVRSIKFGTARWWKNDLAERNWIKEAKNCIWTYLWQRWRRWAFNDWVQTYATPLVFSLCPFKIRSFNFNLRLAKHL